MQADDQADEPADEPADDEDARLMAAALALGRRGLGRTAPNPAVGCLVVKDGLIVGRGWTADGGRPHAEPLALAQAGSAAKGATLYVTLEPCSHHGRTPPCCEAIVAAGIARLVYAIDDPNPSVAGRGAAFCRTQGLAVRGGVGAAAAARDHRGHILRMTAGRPMVTLKLAETADGFVAGGAHDARLAITGLAANGLVHVMRAMHDAIMVGIGTALADDPLMTVRLPGLMAKPLRVVLDARLQIAAQSRLLRTAREGPVLILTTEAGFAARAASLADLEGVSIAVLPAAGGGGVDLGLALRHLSDRGITRVFSEGGPRVGSALIGQGLADDVILFRAQRPLGREGVPTMAPAARAILADPARYESVAPRLVGADHLSLFERMA